MLLAVTVTSETIDPALLLFLITFADQLTLQPMLCWASYRPELVLALIAALERITRDSPLPPCGAELVKVFVGKGFSQDASAKQFILTRHSEGLKRTLRLV